MIQYLKCSAAALLMLLVVTLNSCMNADDRLGNSLIPPGQQMEVAIDSNTVVPQTYIYVIDSIITSGTSTQLKYVGSVIDPYVGRTSIQFFSQFVPIPPFDVEEQKYFGVEPTVDSLFMVFNVGDNYGDTTTGTKINMYEVINKDFRYDSTYYSNFKMDKYVSDKPLATFDVKEAKTYKMKLPIEFAKRLLINNQNKTNPYYRDSLFLKVFKGLYFESKPVESGKEGVVYGVNIASSYMRMHYHNKSTGTKADTALVDFVMKGQYYGGSNVNFEMIQHDYTFADPSKGGVQISAIGDTVNQCKIGYIQGIGGLGTSVTILGEHIETLKQKVKAAGYRTLAIQAAELEFAVESPTWQNLGKMFGQLAAYYSFSPLIFSPDYNPLANPTETIGGMLDRSNAKYSLNISRYVQGLVNGTISEKKRLQIEPAMSQYLAAMTRSLIKGSASDTPPKLIITYTMLK